MAKGASFLQRNFASKKHDVRNASPGGQRQMSTNSWAPSAAGVLPGLKFQVQEVRGFRNSGTDGGGGRSGREGPGRAKPTCGFQGRQPKEAPGGEAWQKGT